MSAADVLASTVILVGPGRAGSAFARSWLSAGGRLASVIVRGPTVRPRGPWGDAAIRSIDEPAFPACDVLILAVPDDAVAATSRRLAGRLSCRYALHLSGVLGSEAIAALRGEGAAVASIHPVRPFTGAEHEDWRGAFVAIEGDPAATETGERIASAVGARPYRLCASDKPLYHAAASLAAGGAAAVLSVAVRGWVAAGIPEDIARETLAALASRATAAVAERRAFADVFTGAVARRDVGTVRAHVEALASHPEALELYRPLAEEILRRTAGRGREEEIREILRAENRAPEPTSGSS